VRERIMSQNLYDDAIAEALRLADMAEENARNKIIDAVTPRIRSLIERQLLGEDDGLDPLDDELEDDAPAGDEIPGEGGPEVLDLDAASDDLAVPEAPSDDLGMPPASLEPMGAPVDLALPGDDDADAASVSVTPDGEVEVSVGDISIEVDTSSDEGGFEDEDDLLLGQEVAEALARMVSQSTTGRQRLQKRIKLLESRIKVLRKALPIAKRAGSTNRQRQRIAQIFESLAREAVILRRQVILTEQDTGGTLLEKARINSVIKEMKQMSRRRNRNIFDFLFEQEEDLELAPEEGEAVEGEEAPLEEPDIDAAEDALLDLGDALGLEVEVLPPEGEEGEEGEEAPEDELDLEETYEIDEAMLRRELRRIRKLNENDPVDGSGDSSFGGGDAEDEPFVEVDEDDLLNALADELGDAPVPDAGGGQPPGHDAMPESYRRRRARVRRMREAARRRASARGRRPVARRSTGGRRSAAGGRQIAEYRKVVSALKGQLTEMNLFNAKLLYANKLIQNRNLTAKQQRAIVEALDNAKTLREAKLLYKSLTSSLKKVSRKNLQEGRSSRSLGSSSRSTRSASPSNSGNEVDRWAVLAGIDNGGN